MEVCMKFSRVWRVIKGRMDDITVVSVKKRERIDIHRAEIHIRNDIHKFYELFLWLISIYIYICIWNLFLLDTQYADDGTICHLWSRSAYSLLYREFCSTNVFNSYTFAGCGKIGNYERVKLTWRGRSSTQCSFYCFIRGKSLILSLVTTFNK